MSNSFIYYHEQLSIIDKRLTMKNTDIITKLYEYLADYTPFMYDCGKICNKKCCNGNDHDGMLLFPGEKEIYDDKSGFDVYFDERYSSYAVRCSGKCNRNERPLSCRIFPYFFYLSEETENRIKVAPDIRAVDFCPIIDNTDDVNKKFLRALRICALKIEQENEFRDYLFDITEIITDFGLLD